MIDFNKKTKNGEALNEIIILDCHNHMGKWQAFYIPNGGTAEQMVRCMDTVGINKVFVTAHASIGPDYIYGNNMVEAAINKYPDRILGYVTLNPNYPDDMKPELERRFANPGFKGIKLHPSCHGREIDYKDYKPAYEYADAFGLPILIHVWGAAHVAAVERLSKVYTNAKFIMGHFGANPAGFAAAVELINNRDNVYGDLALSFAPEGNIEWLVAETNPKRILYGTDMPFYDPRPTVGRLAMADIPYETKLDIFGRSLAEIINL